MGRAPCCDKANVKKGPWSPEEDAKLKSYIEQHGTGGNWIALPQKIGLKRCGKSCRLRWLNYLRPNIKHGGFSEEEDNIICSLYISIGSRWSIIAAQLPGRTDNDIKNYWNTRLKKKLLGGNKQRKNNQLQTGQSMMKHDYITKRGTSTGLLSGTVNSTETMIIMNNNNQNPYWPELPILAAPTPYSADQQPRCDDHESIRKLLIRLGGKFSDELLDSTTQSQPPIDHHNSQQLYNETMLMNKYMSTTSTPPPPPPPEFGSELVQYNNNSQILAGQISNATISNPGQLVVADGGLEFFYGHDHHHQDHNISWGDDQMMISSLVYNNSNINDVPIINVSEEYPGADQRSEIILSAQECIFSE